MLHITPAIGQVVGNDADSYRCARTLLHALLLRVRNVSARGEALREPARVLRPGGRFLCLEFSPVATPGPKQLYDAFSMHAILAIGKAVAYDADSCRCARTLPLQILLLGIIDTLFSGSTESLSIEYADGASCSDWPLCAGIWSSRYASFLMLKRSRRSCGKRA